MTSYIVKPFRKPKTPILKGTMLIVCPTCGNHDQDKMLTVTSLGPTLQGFVCAYCEGVETRR